MRLSRNLHLPSSPSALLLSSLRRPHAPPLSGPLSPRHITPPSPSQRRSAGTFRGIKLRAKLSSKDIPNDVGLLDGTFVMPSQPSLFRAPRLRLRLYMHRIIKMVENLRLMLNWRYGTDIKPRPKIRFFRVHREAADLHARLTNALFDGDKKQLSSICCEGLYQHLSAKIDQRGVNKQLGWVWKQHRRWSSYPRVVSSRSTVFPGMDKTVLRQHVVRIRATEGAQDRKEAEAERSGKRVGKVPMHTYTHYVVIQKRILRGKEGPWKVWGMTEETDPNTVLGEPGKKAPRIAVPTR